MVLRDRLTIRDRTFGWPRYAFEKSAVDGITAGDDVAFAHYLYRVTGTMTNGTALDMWLRTSMGLRKIDGAWTITHEHTSVPFDTESGRAALDLTP